MPTGRRMSREEQIQNMTSVHKGFYTYENWGHPTCREKSLVTCPEHGDWPISYDHHYHLKNGCPECGHIETDS